MISQEAFAQQLQLSDPSRGAGAFSSFQQEAKGLVDFYNAAIALVPLDGGKESGRAVLHGL